ncbi:MAG: 23S rRNA (adenine(2503)-C(2))-methyltransferase RlmN [Planctomycetota bacterium]
MPDDRPHFFDQTPETLADLCAGWGLPRFRAKQVFGWVYAKGVADPRQMTNLSARDRELLADRLRFVTGQVVRHQNASDGTQKLLIDWNPAPGSTGVSLQLMPADDDPPPSDQTECVMIPTAGDANRRPRRTACISSQVGCPVGCKFCASGLGGLDGNLTAGQIVQQAWQLQQLTHVGRLTNVVFMGMGEPMANLRAVLPAVRTLAAGWGLGLSARRITVSTVGVPAGIRKLADLDLPVTLAVSLHAPNDQLRQQIIPWAEFVSIQQLTDAGRDYFAKTGREVTLEYILLGHVNDRPEHARELATVAKRLRSNVNLIRYNEVAGLPYARPDDADVLRFQSILKSAGVNTHLRASRGRDIAAACGQLRHEAAAV